MEAPGARSLYFQQQSAALAAAAAAAAAADGDNSSVGFNSVQSLWRGGDNMGGGGGMGSISLASSDDNYSAKTASHVLQAPQRSKTKPSKIISKMRRQNMRNVSASSGAGFEDPSQRSQPNYMTIEGETLFAGGNGRAGHYYGTAGLGSSSNNNIARMPRTPVSVDLSSPSPVMPSPLSLGSSAQLLASAGYGHGHGATHITGMRPSPWLSNALVGGTAGSLASTNGSHSKHQQQQQPFSPTISVSGQGFVAPLVLPRLI